MSTETSWRTIIGVNMDKLGLIAGGGNFPVIFAKEAKKKGAKVIAFAIKGVTETSLSGFVDKIHWVDPTRFNIPKFLFLLMTERIKKMVMVGKIDKSKVFRLSQKDSGLRGVLESSKDSRDYSILKEVTKRFNQIGIQVVDGLEYLSDLLPEKGVLTKRSPSPDEERDIEFGMRIAKEIVRLDIGQTSTVKNRAVVTIEAMEGTDEAIRRAKEIVGGDFIVIKVARPDQDMRWDVPLIGANTIKTMIESKARVLAIESGKMFFIEREKTIFEADLHGISIVVV